MSHSPFSEKILVAVRGATTLSSDGPEIYEQEVIQLVQELVRLNGFKESDILNIFFTVTPDLHSANPARIVRHYFDWVKTPMMCSLEPDVIGLPPFCVRVLFQYYALADEPCPRPLYLNQAKSLRPDFD